MGQAKPQAVQVAAMLSPYPSPFAYCEPETLMQRIAPTHTQAHAHTRQLYDKLYKILL